MPTTYITTNTINAGTHGFSVAAGDEVVVMPNVTVGSTGAFNGINGAGLGLVTVHGSVFGLRGIYVNTSGASGLSQIVVGATGTVVGQAGNEAILASGALFVDNAGTISCLGGAGNAVRLSSTTQALTLINSGTITGDNAVRSLGQGIIVNHGTITGISTSITTSQGASSDDTLTNFGAINGNVGTAGGSDTVTNGGTIVGNVDLGNDADTYTGRLSGQVTGFVDGGAGDDTLTGGDAADDLRGGANADTLRGGGGIDVLDGGSEGDTIYFSIEDASVTGGAGFDTAVNTYDAFGLTFDVGGNGFDTYLGSLAGETILTTTMTAISVSAGGGNDLVQGSSVGDFLSGQGGDDTILAGNGTDTLQGGLGNDILRGDDGIDNLSGDEGNDRFVFNGVFGGNDTILDFSIGEDKIQILRSGFLSPASWNAGALDPARFVASANPSPILGTAAFLFDNAGPGVGQLFWNDGNGGAIGIANIIFAPGQSPLFFTAADFVLI